MQTSLKGVILKVVVIPLLAMKLIGWFNIFEYFTFIPEDRVFTLGLSAYLGILEFFWLSIVRWIQSRYCKIKCTFSKAGESVNINSIPEVRFNQQDIAKVSCTVEVSGYSKRLLKNSIEISFPKWVDVQIESSNIIILQNNTYKIDLESMINENEGVIGLHTLPTTFCSTSNSILKDKGAFL